MKHSLWARRVILLLAGWTIAHLGVTLLLPGGSANWDLAGR